MFKRKKQEECQILFVNEITRIIRLVKGKAKEGQIHYKDKTWLVQTDPLFYEDKALYIVSDNQIPTFEIEIGKDIGKNKENETEEPREKQNSVKPETLSPTALKTAVTTSFFKALMSPVYWSRGDWVKALGVGFTFYVLLKWVMLSVFKVPLP